MVLTHELLTRVEEECATAPAVLLRQRIALILGLANNADRELREHAQALLLKLERRLREECDEPSTLRPPTYLSPDLRLPTADTMPRRQLDPVHLLRSTQRSSACADGSPSSRTLLSLFASWRLI